MAPDRHHERPLLRDPERDPIQGLLQQRARPEQGHVLLRPVVSAHAPRQGPQPHALAAREDNRPETIAAHRPAPARRCFRIPSAASVFAMDRAPSASSPVIARMASIVSGITMASLCTW